jgi:hypothetical protein
MLETGDTLVVCRPGQVKEAALVLSCCTPGKFTPLVVFEPPPIPEQEYRVLYRSYVEVRDRRDQFTGAAMARKETVNPARILALNEEVDLKTERLTPYRSWVKHNQFLSKWLQKIAPRRAIFLFEIGPDELRLIDPQPRSQISEERFAVFPEATELFYLLPGGPPSVDKGRRYYKTLAGLAELAWSELRGGSFPESAVNVAESDLAAWFAGLHLALQSGMPIRPVQPTASLPANPSAGNVEGDEAVVVEIANDATRLLGILYAHMHGAKPVFYNEPNLDAIEVARSAIERQQEESAKDLRYVASHRASGMQLANLSQAELATLKSIQPIATPGGAPFERKHFLDALRRLFHRPDPLSLITKLEEAVSAAVPDSVIAEAGERAVTAFTKGVPYSFVRKNDADWSRKTIGHITGDSSLLVLEDLIPTGDDPGVGFNLLFDPGYFTTSETHDVLNELQRRVSYSIVLSGLAGASLSLIHLSATLPVELLFFNTHGSNNAILLRDMLLPAYKLVQRVTMRSRPIVFNNSCLSWVGVGREFIRSGARGYIGTLWSVDAAQAADFARIAMQRMIQENMAVPLAMRETGVDPFTERAYIFVGPARARLAPESATGNERHRLIRSAEFLLNAAILALEQAGGNTQSPFEGPLVEILVKEAEWICDELDRRHPEAGLDRLDLFIQQLRLRVELPITDNATGERISDIIRRGQDMLSLPQADAHSITQRKIQLTHMISRAFSRTGKPQQAIAFLNQSISAAKEINEPSGPQYLELSDAFKSLGGNGDALAAAENAKQAFTAADGTMDKEAAVGVLGRLAQLSLRVGKYDDALKYAVDGNSVAVSLDNLREQTMFKGDETRVLLRLHRKDEALVTANEMLSLARRAHDDWLEISAYGVLTQVLMAQEKWPQAQAKLKAGMDQAKSAGLKEEVGDFLVDLAQVKERTGNLLNSLTALREAAPIFVGLGRLAKLQSALLKAGEITANLNSWRARTEMIGMLLDILDGLDAGMRRSVCTETILTVKDGIREAGLAASRKPLRKLTKEINAELASNVSQQRRFIARAIQMFSDLASGGPEKARQEAAELDQLSKNGFELVAFLDEKLV